MKTTKETRELLAAILAISIRYRTAMADGRISWLELAGFLRDAPGVKLALESVAEVAAEALDLTDDELPGITSDISNILNAWGVSHRLQDVTADVARGLAAMVPTVKTFVAQASAMLDAMKIPSPFCAAGMSTILTCTKCGNQRRAQPLEITVVPSQMRNAFCDSPQCRKIQMHLVGDDQQFDTRPKEGHEKRLMK